MCPPVFPPRDFAHLEFYHDDQSQRIVNLVMKHPRASQLCITVGWDRLGPYSNLHYHPLDLLHILVAYCDVDLDEFLDDYCLSLKGFAENIFGTCLKEYTNQTVTVIDPQDSELSLTILWDDLRVALKVAEDSNNIVFEPIWDLSYCVPEGRMNLEDGEVEMTFEVHEHSSTQANLYLPHTTLNEEIAELVTENNNVEEVIKSLMSLEFSGCPVGIRHMDPRIQLGYFILVDDEEKPIYQISIPALIEALEEFLDQIPDIDEMDLEEDKF